MAKRYTLVGAHEGKTIKLGDYQFTNGEHYFDGSEQDSFHLTNILSSFYSAWPDDKLQWAREQYAANTGQPTPTEPVSDKLARLQAAEGLTTEPTEEELDAEQDRLDAEVAAQKLKDDEAATQKLKDDEAAAQKLKDDEAAAQKLKDDEAAAQKLKDDEAAAQKLKDDEAAAQKLKDDEAAAAAENKGFLVGVLKQLDPANDDHWTQLGLPEVKAVETLAGKSVTRKEIDEAAKGFNRAAAKAAAEKDPLA